MAISEKAILFVRSKLIYNKVRVVNMLVTALFRKEGISNSELLKINISGCPNGLYMINLSNTEKHKMRSKMVIVQ